MRKHTIILALIGLALLEYMPASSAQSPVTSGSALDYQGSVLQPWNTPQQRVVVFERLDPGTLSGDLFITHSKDAGESWSTPSPVIDSSANERHAEMVQTGESTFQLFFLSNASGGFRIHRASSTDGETFSDQGAVELGWQTGGEVNPHVVRLPDGQLILAYHRLSGKAYLSWSNDDGVSWDTGRTQVSPGNAALPRIAWRESDGRFLLTYQTNPGNNQLKLWSRTSTDPGEWVDSPVQVTADSNNHDAMPLVLHDGSFALIWARVIGGSFQLVSATSDDGSTWSQPVQRSHRDGLANIQPHGIALGNGCVDLYWGAEEVAGGNDYDILRQLACFDPMFRDRFE